MGTHAVTYVYDDEDMIITAFYKHLMDIQVIMD